MEPASVLECRKITTATLRQRPKHISAFTGLLLIRKTWRSSDPSSEEEALDAAWNYGVIMDNTRCGQGLWTVPLSLMTYLV